MAKFNPRYGTNAGYAAGDMLYNLGQLLRQGIGDYERQTTVDEESKRRDADYLLRLQQFMTGAEDRDLDRQIKKDTLAGTAADRKAKADLEAEGRSGRTKIAEALGILPGLPTELTPNEVGNKDVFAGLLDFYEKSNRKKGDRLSRNVIDVLRSMGQDPDTASPEDIKAARAQIQTEEVAKQAATGENAARAPLQPAEGPRPMLPKMLRDLAPTGGIDRNPDFREGMQIPVEKGSSVAKAAERDLFSGKSPFPTAPAAPERAETVIEQKKRLEDEAALGVKQRAPVGEHAGNYVLRSTGLPPPPDMPTAQVQKDSVAVTPQQLNAIGAARRGLTILKELEGPEITGLFPDNPFQGKGIGAVVGNAARAKLFGMEAQIRGMSDPDYAKLVTTFATAVPALAKATGEVGNLSAMEQEVVKEGMGIARTREAFANGIRTYREILERGFRANGIPVPAELRGLQPSSKSGGTPAASGGAIRVRRKSDGLKGTLDSEAEFDPALYERLP